MGYIFSEVYIWPRCPLNFSDNIVEGKDDRMEEFAEIQNLFAKTHDIELFNLVPSIQSEKIDTPMTEEFFQVTSKHLSFSWGLEALEISFHTTKSSTGSIFEQPPSMKKGSNFGYAVDFKLKRCKGKKVCQSCRKKNLKLVLSTLIVKNTNNFEKILEDKFRSNSKFITESFSRHISDDNQIILDKTTRNGRKKVMNSLLWTTVSLLGVIEFGKSFVIEALRNIPKYRIKDNEELFDQKLLIFKRYFLTIYFWLNPNFLTLKEGIKLNARTLEINSFLYVSRECVNLSYWSDYSILIEELKSSSPIITSVLYDLCSNVPNNLLGKFIENVNIFNIQIPSYTIYKSKLTEYQQKILDAFGRHITDIYHAKQYDQLEYIEKTALTLRQIRIKSGYASGSMSEKISNQVFQLVDRKILIQIEENRTNAKFQYYLNPEFPYCQLLLSQFS